MSTRATIHCDRFFIYVLEMVTRGGRGRAYRAGCMAGSFLWAFCVYNVHTRFAFTDILAHHIYFTALIKLILSLTTIK